jgi:DNA-binding transcriptional LysR family regulator
MIGRLQERHRGLIVELVLTNRAEDLLRRDADIAVRMVEPKQAAIVARRIGAIPLGLFAHRDYLARRGRPQTLADLAGHTIIGFDRDDSAARAVGAPGALTREAFGFRTDSDLAQFTAVRTGVGIGVCQAPLASTVPELEAVLPDEMSFQLEMWVAMHEDLRSSQRIRSTFDHLVAELRHYVDWSPVAL